MRVNAVIYPDNAATSWHKTERIYQTMDEYMRKKADSPVRSSHNTVIAAPEAVEEMRTIITCFLMLVGK